MPVSVSKTTVNGIQRGIRSKAILATSLVRISGTKQIDRCLWLPDYLYTPR